MELAELRDRYSPIKGVAMDGMPHGSTPGDSTASLAVKLADNEEYKNRENELTVRRVVLKSDLQEIRQKLDRLNDDYKTILKRAVRLLRSVVTKNVGKHCNLHREKEDHCAEVERCSSGSSGGGCSMKFP